MALQKRKYDYAGNPVTEQSASEAFNLVCDFCEQPVKAVRWLIRGGEVLDICYDCILDGRHKLRGTNPGPVAVDEAVKIAAAATAEPLNEMAIAEFAGSGPEPEV